MRTVTAPPQEPQQEALPVAVSTQLAKVAAIALSQKYKISVRAGYYHLKRGSTPASNRRRGRDGKTYPAGNSRKPSPVEKNLRLSWQALKRSEYGAGEGFDEVELALLERIAEKAKQMVESWRAAE